MYTQLCDITRLYI